MTDGEEMTLLHITPTLPPPVPCGGVTPPVCGVRLLAGMAGRVRARTGDEAEEEECQHSVLSR